MNSYKSQILNGVFWTTLQVLIGRSFSFIIQLVLVKILLPKDFGIVGMAAIFSVFIAVFNDLGFGAALVQMKDDKLKASHYHTAFWTGLIWSLFLYLIILFLVAPFAAFFYKEPIIKYILPVLSISILASPLYLVHNAILTKNLNFKKLSLISNFSSIFSGFLALGLAFLGAGVWSLVFNSVATFVIAIPMYYNATRWIPKFIWDKNSFKEIFGFGINTTGTSFFNTLISQFDYLVVGKLLSSSALGIYSLAFLLTDVVRHQIMNVMNTVMFPIYGKKQNDTKALVNYYLKVVKFNSLVIYPILIIYIFYGEQLILSLYGTVWMESVLPLKILAFSVLFHLMVSSNTALIRGMGKPQLELKLQFFKAIVFSLPLIFIGTYYYGIIGTSIAILLNKILSVFIAQYFLKKLLGITIMDLFNTLKTPLLSFIFASILSIVFIYVINCNWKISVFFTLLVYFSVAYYFNKKIFVGFFSTK